MEIMKEYGFEPSYPDGGKYMKKSLGNFEEIIDRIDNLLDDKEKDIQRAYLQAKIVQKDEKYRKLSGLNNWFIFKRV